MKLIFIFLFSFLALMSYSQSTPSIDSVTAQFCKVWGFLKYYHPEVAKGKLDWDKEFVSKIDEIKVLHSKEQINDFYFYWIASLGELKPFTKNRKRNSNEIKFNLDNDWLYDSISFTKELISKFDNILKYRNQSKNFYVQQIKGVGNTSYKNEYIYKDSLFPSPELRLLCLARYWNIINYFFPYKYVIGEHWDNVLLEMLPRFRSAKDTTVYNLAIKELTVRINDTHGIFYTKYTYHFFGEKWVPFQSKIIDNKSVVTGYLNERLCKLDDIRIGDVFTAVNNQSIKSFVKENSKYVEGSNAAVKLRNMADIIYSGNSDYVETTMERDGTKTTKIIRRYNVLASDKEWRIPKSQDTARILGPNIGYLNLDLIDKINIDASLDKVKNTRAIIIDMRNYPHQTLDRLADFLNLHKKPFAKATIPEVNFPGMFSYAPMIYCGSENNKCYNGKIVLLINEETQSQAEFTAMALQTAERVTTIGSQTAGADGDYSEIILPGNYKTGMSGVGIYYPDGKVTQRIGIVPDIEVHPTIQGIRSGRDEVLECAIQYLN